MIQSHSLFICALLIGLTPPAHAADQTTKADALRALKSACAFYREKVASHGGYVYFYSEDLSRRWGEGKATPEMAFVQPPGTPRVGEAYLAAHDATGDPFYLDAAREAAGALIYGQLKSGGWTQVVHFAPAKRIGMYRNGKGGSWNASSLDDGQTQAALLMLIHLDAALNFKDGEVHDCATYGLNALLKAQFPNGGFPQVWTGPAPLKPIVPARYPDYDWKTEGRIKNYWDHYTLNDNLAGTVADVLIEAHRVYHDEKYTAALRKLGDFLILAQMPAPQPGWCQQYNDDMVPIWARKFEPPALTGWESQDVMRTLIKIAQITGDKTYLNPIPRALAYYKTCLLPDGRIARYYEFKTNRPLYMDANYQLTYDDSHAPSHYGWTQPAHFSEIERLHAAALHGSPPVPTEPPKALESDVRRIIQALDPEGRWVSTYNGEPLTGQPKFPKGFRYLSSEVFHRNVEILSASIKTTNR